MGYNVIGVYRWIFTNFYSGDVHLSNAFVMTLIMGEGIAVMTLYDPEPMSV